MKKITRHKTGHKPLPEHCSLSERARRALRELPKGRCRRLVAFLLKSGPCTTAEIASVCAIGNVSDAVLSALPALQRHGLAIEHGHRCGLKNRYGEPTLMHVWRLVSL